MARRSKTVEPEEVVSQETEPQETGEAETTVAEAVQEAPDQMNSMSVAELNNLIERATAARDGKIGAERQAFIDRIRAEAEGLGLSMQDLAAPPKPEKKTAGGREPAGVKYRDPETGGTWSGRGRMSTIFRERLDQGRSLDEFLVR